MRLARRTRKTGAGWAFQESPAPFHGLEGAVNTEKSDSAAGVFTLVCVGCVAWFSFVRRWAGKTICSLFYKK